MNKSTSRHTLKEVDSWDLRQTFVACKLGDIVQSCHMACHPGCGKLLSQACSSHSTLPKLLKTGSCHFPLQWVQTVRSHQPDNVMCDRRTFRTLISLLQLLTTIQTQPCWIHRSTAPLSQGKGKFHIIQS